MSAHPLDIAPPAPRRPAVAPRHLFLARVAYGGLLVAAVTLVDRIWDDRRTVAPWLLGHGLAPDGESSLWLAWLVPGLAVVLLGASGLLAVGRFATGRRGGRTLVVGVHALGAVLCWSSTALDEDLDRGDPIVVAAVAGSALLALAVVVLMVVSWSRRP